MVVSGTGYMAQWLSALSALLEDLHSVLRTQMEPLRMDCNSSSRAVHTLSGLQSNYTHMCYMHVDVVAFSKIFRLLFPAHNGNLKDYCH